MRYDTGGDLLVAVLRELGIDTVFGIVSVHNLPLVEAVDRELRFVPVRHEASAVNAADAYGRARGTLGCALTSTGTGAGNAAGSLIEALASGTSVLHITGQVESEFLGSGRGFIHETKDQLGMLTAVSKYAATVPSADAAGRILREAARAALTAPGGPASVEWPVDLQYAAQTDTAVEFTEAAVPAPGEDELAAAGALLASAERPVIWAGGGATRARTQLADLLAATGAALVTSNSGRGAVPEDHPQVVGNFATTPPGGPCSPTPTCCSRSAPTSGPTRPPTTGSDSRRAHPDRPGRGRARPCVPGAARAARRRRRRTGAAAPVREARRAGLDGAGHRGPRRGARHPARQHRPAGRHLRRDPGRAPPRGRRRPRRHHPVEQLGQPAPRHVRPARQRLPRGGGIGQGLGMGIGAALARPDAPTVVIAGDGGLAVHLGELLTLAQERPA